MSVRGWVIGVDICKHGWRYDYPAADCPYCEQGEGMMAFSKRDRERGVTSGEVISCAPAPHEAEPEELLPPTLDARASQWANPAPDREGEMGTDIEVIENLEALAALTGDNEGILRAAIDRISSLEQEVANLRRQMETARADAFEEAAKIADLSAYYNGGDESRCEVAATIAREIRALNSLKTEG